MNENVKTKNTIQSVDRAIQILKLFEDHEELGVTEISKRLSLHKSTTFGLITTLESNNMLEKNELTNKYRLGMELFCLGTKVNSGLRQTAYPYLEKLVALYSETVNLVILEYPYVVYLEKVESSHSMRISTAIGEIRPLYCTAVGKALLANMTDDKIREYIDSIELKKHTPNTIVNSKILQMNLEKIRKLGYSTESEELEVGLCCIAAPIFNHIGKAFAAISVSGPVSRMGEDMLENISKTLTQFTREISSKLGSTL
ncbi:IclR family transcriptional regulator [Wukongibacter sp. M2B1]|uniref:IclR family transcriptional regulator n=1 Tax=Wukongibacter sp. M2B1 TaxID=3088895 RepID=UPI003D7A685A